MLNPILHVRQQVLPWIFQEKHRSCARQIRAGVEKAFTEHPRLTGETYAQHLWFTVRMSLRFVVVSFVLLTHGLFPFLFTRTASIQIEHVYLLMKSRIPKTRRDEIDMYDI